MQFLRQFFETTTLSPHGICLLWRPELIWTHLIADALTGFAYFSIPLALGVFLYHRRDLRFGWAIWMFVAFIMLCGVTHFMAILTLYKPYYGIEALLKALTAIVSVMTAIALWPLLPRAVAIPSAKRLEQMIAERDEAISEMIEMKEHERRQALLVNELNHRVKNTLATVQAIATQSMSGATSAADFQETFEARLMSLSRTHNVLVQHGWANARLSEIVNTSLSLYGKPYSYSGLDLQLDANFAVSMGMAVHELATNCVKYGSWSDNGVVEILVEQNDDDIIVRWLEEGGPRITKPTSFGFGTRLLTRGLAREMAAQVKMDYRPDGLKCAISFRTSDRVSVI